MPDKILSISEAAEYLGVFPLTLRNWEKRGKIRPFRTVGGHRRFRKSDLDTLLGTGDSPEDKFRSIVKDLEAMKLEDMRKYRLETIVAQLKELSK